MRKPNCFASLPDAGRFRFARPDGLRPPHGPAPDLVWGVHGIKPGRLHKPRTAAFDSHDHLYLADLTDRIQVFNRDGKFLRGWSTPEFNVDGPSGLTVDRLGRLLVADTHFYRVLVYSSDGEFLFEMGDGVQGTTPGPSATLPTSSSTVRAISWSRNTARTIESRFFRPKGIGSASGEATAMSRVSS